MILITIVAFVLYNKISSIQLLMLLSSALNLWKFWYMAAKK